MKNNPGKMTASIMSISLISNVLLRGFEYGFANIFDDLLFLITCILDIIMILILYMKNHNPVVTIILFLNIILMSINIYSVWKFSHPFSESGIFLVWKILKTLYIIPPVILFIMSLNHESSEISSKFLIIFYIVLGIVHLIVYLIVDKQAEALQLNVDYIANINTIISHILMIILTPLKIKYLTEYIYEY